jgi:hypothetical protein
MARTACVRLLLGISAATPAASVVPIRGEGVFGWVCSSVFQSGFRDPGADLALTSSAASGDGARTAQGAAAASTK